jgi:hypothetical protein
MIKDECELDKSHMAYKKAALGMAFPLNESYTLRQPKLSTNKNKHKHNNTYSDHHRSLCL